MSFNDKDPISARFFSILMPPAPRYAFRVIHGLEQILSGFWRRTIPRSGIVPSSISWTRRPGTVSFTATRWGKLLDPKKMPSGEKPLTAADAYRFVLPTRQ